MRTVIHFSGFVGDNDSIIVKELSIVHPDIDSTQTWLFKPPYPLSKLSKAAFYNNLELTQHIFGFNWDDGDVEYKDLKRILSTYLVNTSCIYTFGTARQIFVQDIIQKTVFNLEDLQCPKYDGLAFPSRTCAFPLHRYANYRCSLKEAWIYSQFLKYQELALCVPSVNPVYHPTPITESDEDEPTH